MNDIKSIVYDEIALEGLDGITIYSLWIRLQQIDFPLKLDHSSTKCYIWKNLILKYALNELKFYCLPEKRETIQIYNRYDYISSETGYCINNEERIPTDIYSDICPIDQDNVRGSCKHFNERVLVSLGDLNELNLDEVEIKYDNKLIIVANQHLREKALRINFNDPLIFLRPVQYCMIERVGRCRRLGEITFGKESAKFKEPPKTLFLFSKAVT